VSPLRRPSGSSILSLLSLTLAGAAPGGCALQGEPEPALVTAEIGGDCPNFGCNSNSPLVDGSPIHELDEGPTLSALLDDDGELDQGGEFNSWGTRLVHLVKAGVVYRLDVRRDRPRALDGAGHVVWQGADLVGSTIVLERADGTPYYVFIEGYHDTLTFWVGPPDPIQTFLLTWAPLPTPGEHRRPVCPLVAASAEWGASGLHEAIFFQGDRYDADTKRVVATGSDAMGWFNVACAGSATAKMHTNRHTRAGATEGFTATPLQEQALLRMFVADYCRTGKAFTVIGQPLRWQNRLAWQTIDLPDPIQYEAAWDSGGAVCLDVPRMSDTPAELAETLAAIQDECDLPPPCSDPDAFPVGWDRSVYLMSANP